MIFTYSFFEKNKLPKFYGNVARIMKSVSDSVFVDNDDIKRLHAVLKKQLEKDKPVNSTAYVDLFYNIEGNGGGINVHPDKNDVNGGIIRIQFATVSNIFEYDESTERFFYVSAHFRGKEVSNECD